MRLFCFISLAVAVSGYNARSSKSVVSVVTWQLKWLTDSLSATHCFMSAVTPHRTRLHLQASRTKGTIFGIKNNSTASLEIQFTERLHSGKKMLEPSLWFPLSAEFSMEKERETAAPYCFLPLLIVSVSLVSTHVNMTARALPRYEMFQTLPAMYRPSAHITGSQNISLDILPSSQCGGVPY